MIAADFRENVLEGLDFDPELETRLEHIFVEIAHEMYGLLFSIHHVRNQMSHIKSQIAPWQNFCRCIIAFSFFAIPMILAMGIAYATAEMVTSRYKIQDELNALIKFLMFISVSNGLPLYTYILWDVHFSEDEEEGTSGISDGLASDSVNDSEATLEFIEEVIAHLAAFRSVLRVFIELQTGDGSNQGEREQEDVTDPADSPRFSIQTTTAGGHSDIQSANRWILDLNFEDFLDSYIGSSEDEEDECWKIITVSPSEDIVTTDEDEIVRSILEDMLFEIENTQAKGVSIEKMSE